MKLVIKTKDVSRRGKSLKIRGFKVLINQKGQGVIDCSEKQAEELRKFLPGRNFEEVKKGRKKQVEEEIAKEEKVSEAVSQVLAETTEEDIDSELTDMGIDIKDMTLVQKAQKLFDLLNEGE